MITRDGFPIVSKSAIVDIEWSSSDASDVTLVAAQLVFDNVNVSTVGNILKERTSLPFDPIDPIPWPAGVSEGVTSVWQSPEDALREVLTFIYESDEHQYRLGTKIRPE